MTQNDQVQQQGDELFEAFVEEVKQVLEHLYDFAYLQQHPLARYYDHDGDLSAKTAGRQLRYELIKAVESLKPQSELHFRSPDARLYNILHLYYIENLNVQMAAAELGLSERQAYRDLRRGQESVAAVLWNNRLPPTTPQNDFSLESEVARLKLNVSTVDIDDIFRKAQRAVENLARQQSITIGVDPAPQAMKLSTDAVLAHQVLVNLLSTTIQQANAGTLRVSFNMDSNTVALTIQYPAKDEIDTASAFSGVTKLAQVLHWEITHTDMADQACRVSLRMTSEIVTLLVIDDNEGWIELLRRFMEGYDCLIISASADQDFVQQAVELRPTLIILDVMMPERDGWELLQRLRMQPITARIPIIVCTVIDDAQLAYSLGASGFVSKPANREKILQALEEFNII
ncbi:MAG: response regulator [Anaerolineae bacterium]|nr:response regulator [Anaerolineae bacterium]